ncbi:Uncharacterized protein APZ42_006087 [Daphnia magna]|uniref:Uncharacterized protein n=1 Tax=Daphnia magna TaxID=35525 RepID=A0A164G3F0_9CRUS|nr:Uncharacterized protein APZ42_006087 [Daphnia magna]
MAEHNTHDIGSMRAVAHVPKFDGTNHREWNYQLHLSFQGTEIDEVVTGAELLPEEVTRTMPA